MDVCPLHAAQALLLDGAPVSEVGAMNSLSRAVWRTSHDRFQLQIHNLTVETQPGYPQIYKAALNLVKKGILVTIALF